MIGATVSNYRPDLCKTLTRSVQNAQAARGLERQWGQHFVVLAQTAGYARAEARKDQVNPRPTQATVV